MSAIDHPLTMDDMRAAVAAALDEPPGEIGDDEDLLARGLDSIGLMRLVGGWRRAGVEVTFAELIEYRTLAEWWALASTRLDGSAAARGGGPEIDEDAPFPLATMQHAYWVGRADGQVLGGVGAHFYNEFDGTGVDPDRLETAVCALLRRHAMLRAAFADDGSQRILPDSPWPGLTIHDLRELAPERVADRLAALRDRMSHTRLAAERGEVFDVRLTLLPGGATRTHVHIEMLVADAHSFRILLSDLAALYADPVGTLPPIGYSYPRYLAAAERDRATSRAADRDYWQQRIAELPSPPELPQAVAPGQVSGHRVTRRHHWLTPAQWAGLARRARGYGLALPAVFLTAFAEVLATWSANRRFLISLPVYDRQPLHPDVDRMVGDFTNLLMLEVDATAERSFLRRAADVQTRMHNDAAHAAYSGMEVLRDLARQRDSATVAAPVVFTSALGLGELFDDGVRRAFGEPAWTMSQTPQVWLDYQVTEREGGLYLNWESVDELFPAGVPDAMFDAYLTLVDWLRDEDAAWDRPVPDLLPAAARQIRERANDTGAPVRDRWLHEDFFARARAESDRLALVWADEGRCTYGVLARQASDLAGALCELGITAGEPVAVTVARGPEQVVAVLGVLRAGASYVPVGADQPVTRRDRIYARAGVRFVVSAAPLPGLPAGITAVPLAGIPAATLPEIGPADPEQVAYTLFTSGSTGEPKGVMVPHRAAVNTIDAINRRFGVGREDRVLAVSALDFDLSVYDIFGLLSVGGTAVLIDGATRRDAARWVELARYWGVTIWQSVPTLLDMFLVAAEDAPAGVAALNLRLALLGGDWVGLDLSRRLARQCAGAQLVALGGTTETAIHSTVQIVPAEPPAHWRSAPYGVPLPNQRLRVVDGCGRDRPDWVTGELWIGGRSVALGYRGDPDRTADRFVTHAGERWYRTGDLARYWPDGTVEFLGRADFQVKIRGHRIELGEIDAALARMTGIARGLALVLGDGAQRRLAAAVVRTEGAGTPVADLRSALAAELPGYMVPDQIFVLDALPLSANGKIDRRAVAAAISAAPVTSSPAPATEVEQAVARIWIDLLGLDPDDAARVGRDQNFFALGGDSLVATRMLPRLARAGLVGASMSQLFATPVLADFAAALRPAGIEPPRPVVTPDAAHRHDPFPPTDVQRAYWMGRTDDFALGGVGSHWYWEFEAADVDLARLEDAVNRLIERHDMLRAVFDDNGDQRVLATVPRFAIQITDARSAPAEEDKQLRVLRETLSERVSDPARWPLLEIGAVRTGTRTRIGFSLDYIVLDALSIVTFFGELSTLYRDPRAPLPHIGVSFRDYLLRAQPDQDRIRAAERYWTGRLADLPPAPALPLAVDPERVRAPRFVRREDRLTPSQWCALTERARRHGVTPAVALAAAYAVVLAAWGGRDDLTLNLTMFNRRDVHPDIDRVLGDFTSLLLAGYRAEPGDGFLAGARRMQEQLWADMEHTTVSAIWVLREMAKAAHAPAVSMPVVFTSALGVAAELTDVEFPFGELIWGISQTPQIWLDNQVMERGGGLVFNWDSVDELFPAGVLDAMFDAYGRLLAWMCTADWTELVPDLLPAPMRAVRAAVNATDGPLSAGGLHEEFFARAGREPDRTALAWGTDGTLSYGALADRALRIAGALREQGLAAGDPVAVTLPSSPGQIAAVLGVLAAGGAYVPVGVEQPANRRDRIYAGAGVRFAVTRAPVAGGIVRVDPGTDAAPLPGPAAATDGQLAYVIYTSGSTGEPKGVEITHQAALNTIEDINQRYAVGPSDRVLAVSALDFDLSVYDIFGLLTAGGALILVDPDERREARGWVALAHRWRATVWNSVPALLDMLLVAGEADGLPDSIRLAMVSGDWVGLDLPGRFAAARPGACFIALGGATEAAIWSNVLPVSEVPAHWTSVPYGFPLRNQRYRVVDGRGRDCPDWVPGELWIGGRGVALGYRGDPRRTARQFVTDADGRWYRTGDQGRYWPDGTLEFLGRTDFQVKIRGHRIELGEIEAVAEAHAAVTRAVAFTIGTGHARQIALAVIPADSGTDLAGHLAARLPAYMVPDRILPLDQPPLTGNGKVDRRALERLATAAPGDRVDEPARTGTERAVADIWAALLEIDEVGRQQSFFTVGGDSLLATRLIEVLRRQFGVVCTLRQIFAAPTVEQLAHLIDAHTGGVAADIEEGVL